MNCVNAKTSVGFKRCSVLPGLHKYHKKNKIHRVEEYVDLLSVFKVK
jgi:hypothetical protein